MPPEKSPPRTSSYHSKLAKAETVLVLALITDLLINPWLYSQPSIPLAGRTLIKMAFIVGLFGPVQGLITRVVDGTLKATRAVTTNMFSLPKMGLHLLIFSTLFVSFYWSMYHRMPWADYQFHGSQQARANSHRAE